MSHINPMSEVTTTPLSVWEWVTVIFCRLAFSILVFLGFLLGPSSRRSPTKVTEHKYGPHRDERLDWIWSTAAVPVRPPIVHIHGGGWIAASKGALYTSRLRKLAERGHPVFSINYPLAPECPHPHILRSLLRALAWIKAANPAFGEVHIIGDSAGGHLAMMLGILRANPNAFGFFDPQELSSLPEVRSIISMYGVLDRTTWIEDGFDFARLFLKAYAGEAALDKHARIPLPVTPMDLPDFDHLPPAFIAAGSKDKLGRSSQICAERLRARFANVEYKIYEGAVHGFFSFGAKSDELNDDVATFLSQH